jgi:hypothetical protein
MEEGPRKRSNAVVLTLIGLPVGAVALANMMPEPQRLQRNLYPDRAACERDYNPQQCEPHPNNSNSSSNSTSSGGSSGGRGGSWHGPYYSSDRTVAATSDPGPGRTGQITRTEATTRGGFGAFGRAMRAVG